MEALSAPARRASVPGPRRGARSARRLDCEDELLALADRIQIAYFLEASSATVEGPYDVSIVEGSITTAHDAERIQEVCRGSRALITIGACAAAGGIQVLRNFGSLDAFTSVVYASPDYISTLGSATRISHHVPVDFELHGCPIDKGPAARGGRRQSQPAPAARARRQRLHGVQAARDGVRDGRARNAVPGAVDLVRVYRTFDAGAEAFRAASVEHEHGDGEPGEAR